MTTTKKAGTSLNAPATNESSNTEIIPQVDKRAYSTNPLDHQGLVKKIALRYRNHGLSLDDLISEGQLGLLRAKKQYDPARGVRFCTYATYWIHQAIGRAIVTQVPLLHIPVYLFSESKVKPRNPEHLAAKDRVLSTKVLRDHTAIRGLAEAVADHDDETDRSEEKADLAAALKRLPPKELKVVKLRYGLDGHEPHKLGEIAALFGFSRSRAGQIHDKALARCRHHLLAQGA